MHRFPLRLSLAVLAVGLLAGAASADIVARIAVRPETIPQCQRGRVAVALGNTGHHPILVRVSLALVNESGVVLGPFHGRLRLAPGERRHREFPFFVPGTFEPGRYAWVLRAAASDETHDVARAPFLVVRGDCVPRTGEDPATEIQKDINEGLGLEPDSPTSTSKETWGSVKRRYR